MRIIKYDNQLLLSGVVCVVVFVPDTKDFGMLVENVNDYSPGNSR